MTGTIIHYKANDIRLTAINFIQSAIAYIFVVNQLISSKNIFITKSNDIFAVDILLLFLEVSFAIGLLALAIYQRNYNRRLMKSDLSNNRWYFSERTLNYVSLLVLILIGICLCMIPSLEVQKGLATGGVFFQNHSLTIEPNLFWQMIYFHLAICFVPIVIGLWLLLFPPRKILDFKGVGQI